MKGVSEEGKGEKEMMGGRQREMNEEQKNRWESSVNC